MKRWLKAELHTHCSLDPVDFKLCGFSPYQLIDEVARQSYDVLAITCHDLDVWTAELSAYARSRGLLLIPGMEVSTEGLRHTLVYNFRLPAEELCTLDRIRRRRQRRQGPGPDTLVIAPHPYFPGDICLGELVERNIDVFDAIESSSFYGRGIDFNRRARKVARAHGKPLIGNGDIHLLWQLGRTFTWIHAEPEVESVLAAIRRGDVRVESRPYPLRDMLRFFATTVVRDAFPALPGPTAGALLPAPHTGRIQ